MNRFWLVVLLSFILPTLPRIPSAWAQSFTAQGKANTLPDELKEAGITEHLGSLVSIKDLTFRDEAGQNVALSSYFGTKKPVLLAMVYYECPNLCSFLLNGLVTNLKEMDWTPGNQFEIVTVSINPRENADLATKKKAAYIKSYGRAQAAPGWHFLTGEDAQIKALAKQVGFGFKWNESEKQYAHSAAVYVLTPEGKISRYLYGIDFGAQNLKLALLEASHGKVGNIVDRFMLFCYRYDPQTRKYSVYLTRLMQVSSAGTVFGFAGFMMVFWRRQRKREQES